jgi:hypothetical protein
MGEAGQFLEVLVDGLLADVFGGSTDQDGPVDGCAIVDQLRGNL